MGSILSYATIQLLSKGIMLLSMYFLAFWGGNESFGYISLAQAFFMVCLVFFGFNFQVLYVRFNQEHHWFDILKSLKWFYFSLFLLSLMVTLVVYHFFGDHESYLWFSFLPLSGFFGAIVVSYVVFSRSKKWFWRYALAELARPVLLVFFLFITYVFFSKSNVLPVYIISLLLSALIVSFYVLRGAKSHTVSTVLSSRSAFFYTFPLFIVQIMSLSNSYLDRFILVNFVSIEELGVYAKAYLIGSSLGVIFDSLMMLWWPFVVSNKSAFMEKYYQSCKVAFFICIACSIFLLLISALLFFSDFRFSALVEVSFLLISAFIARLGYQIFVPIINTFDRTKDVAKISIYCALIGLFLNFILIPYFGIYGAALSTWAAFLFYSIFAYSKTLAIYDEFIKMSVKAS